MNTITIADIKRGGMAALDQALHYGAATIMKRNRPAAIVLTPEAYKALTARAEKESNPASALDWLLNNSNVEMTLNPLGGQAMAQRLSDLKNDWSER
jgi:PHD/YefM family antitoxin component YafN of YafNO toxin-antitoxin module